MSNPDPRYTPSSPLISRLLKSGLIRISFEDGEPRIVLGPNYPQSTTKQAAPRTPAAPQAPQDDPPRRARAPKRELSLESLGVPPQPPSMWDLPRYPNAARRAWHPK
jgi:hypothetical protein